MLHIFELRCILLSYAAPSWLMLHPTELSRTFLCYPALSELGCSLLSYAAPCWATLHPTELCCTLLSYAAPYWATLDPTVLQSTLLSYTLLRYMLHPTALLCNLWATLYPTGLGCAATSLNYATTSELCCAVTNLPFFIQFFWMPGYRTVRHPVSPVPEFKEISKPESVRNRWLSSVPKCYNIYLPLMTFKQTQILMTLYNIERVLRINLLKKTNKTTL